MRVRVRGERGSRDGKEKRRSSLALSLIPVLLRFAGSAMTVPNFKRYITIIEEEVLSLCTL